MKKILAFILVTVLVLAMAGCGLKKNGENPPDETQPTTSTVENPPTEPQTEKPTSPSTIDDTIEKTVIYDDKGIKITANKLDLSEYGIDFPELYVTIENNTDEELTFATYLSSINGYTVYSPFKETVAPNSKVDSVVEFWNDYANPETGCDHIVDMNLVFELIDKDTYETLGRLDPYTLYTSAKGETYGYDEEGYVLVDNNDFKIILRNRLDYDDGDKYQEFYLYNKTDRPVSAYVKNVKVDGKEIDPQFLVDCDAGKRVMEHIDFEKEDMDAAGITNFGTLEMEVAVFDYDSFDILYDSGNFQQVYQ